MPQAASQTDTIWPIFPLFFVAMWIAVSFILSHMGWRSFSTRYPAQFRPPGKVYASPVSWFGSVFASYRNVVHVVFSDVGVYFYMSLLFRAFHPPFLVPWTSVRRVEKKDSFFLRGYRLDIEDAAGDIHVLLPKKVEDDLFKYFNSV